MLGIEHIEKMNARGLGLSPGDFAENITTERVDFGILTVGDRLRLGVEAELEITRFGKACHGRCKIFERIGDCVMPKEGVFAKVIRGGSIHVGDIIEVIEDGNQSSHTDR